MEHNRETYMIFVLILRIIGVIYCASKAGSLNRNQWGWGFFGFVMPIIAMIWISFMKPNMEWQKGK